MLPNVLPEVSCDWRFQHPKTLPKQEGLQLAEASLRETTSTRMLFMKQIETGLTCFFITAGCTSCRSLKLTCSCDSRKDDGRAATASPRLWMGNLSHVGMGGDRGPMVQAFFPMPTREAWVKTCENSGHQLDSVRSVRFLLVVQGGSGGNLQILMMNRKDFLSMGPQT